MPLSLPWPEYEFSRRENSHGAGYPFAFRTTLTAARFVPEEKDEPEELAPAAAFSPAGELLAFCDAECSTGELFKDRLMRRRSVSRPIIVHSFMSPTKCDFCFRSKG